MRGNHNNFKIGRSSERSPSPKEASRLRDDNPESRASKNIQYNIQQMLFQTLQDLKISNKKNRQLIDFIQQNEITIVGAFQALLQATKTFNSFSQIMYRQTESLLLYRSFRSLYEAFSNCSVILHRVTSRDQNFNRAKAQYLTEQSRILTTVNKRNLSVSANSDKNILAQQFSHTHDTTFKYEKTSSTETSPDLLGSERDELIQKISELEIELAQNNEDFSEQIKMYNKLLNEQELEISKCKAELVEGNQNTAIGRLRAEISRCKDQIFKDQLLIQSLTRRIKMLEKDHLFKEPIIQKALNMVSNGNRALIAQRKSPQKNSSRVDPAAVNPY